MSTIRYEILLPLRYNDGRPVEGIRFLETCEELITVFGAITFQPQSVQGVWLLEGERYEDVLTRITSDVLDTPETERFFISFKERLKERFQQIDIWITAYPIRVL